MAPPPHRYLSWVEIACHDGTQYPEEWRDNRLVDLIAAYDHIRALYRRPIRVQSAYRTETYNRLVRGSKNSQHVQGRALDLAIYPGGSFMDLRNACDAAVTAKLVRGIGYYPRFVHIDIRPGRISRWYA